MRDVKLAILSIDLEGLLLRVLWQPVLQFERLEDGRDKLGEGLAAQLELILQVNSLLVLIKGDVPNFAKFRQVHEPLLLLFHSDGVLWHSDVLLSLLIRAALRQTERFTQHVRCLDKSQTVLLFHIEVPLVDVSLVMSHHLLDFSLD